LIPTWAALEYGANAMTAERNAPRSDDSRRLHSVPEAARLLGVGRTYMFRLIATGHIESVKIGKLRKIPNDALDEYIDRLRAEQPVGDDASPHP
jgi:excisionase family DNA binding protein